jgi:Fibronectin type III domain
VYITDIDNDMNNGALQLALGRWHDYFASLTPVTVDAPAGLTVTPVSSTQNDVSWDTVYKAASYQLQRKKGPTGSWSTIATLDAPSTLFHDTNLQQNVQYFYQVRAANAQLTWSLYSVAVTGALFLSEAANDGFANINTPFSTTTGSKGIRAGEGLNSNQQKGFLSFKTDTLPDSGMTIVSAKLRLKQGTGDDAFTTLRTCMVDIKNGFFGTSQALEAADFADAASAINVGQVPPVGQNNWAEVRLNSDALTNVNKTGYTQFRLYFVDDTVDSSISIGWFPGETVGNEPQLLIQYSMP